MKKAPGKPRSFFRRALGGLLALILAGYALCALAVFALRWVDPLTTMVQTQRRAGSFFSRGRYEKRYQFVPLRRISRDLQHAVIAAEDGRFYQHWGIDWLELSKAVEESSDRRRMRGGSTITQQLAKNLFLTTHRNPLRKAAEFSLVPLLELTLGKERILELYLNVVEWGPGVFGAEAASQYHFRTPAGRLSRDQAARLAACLPSPRTRRPQQMDRYGAEILSRMSKMGW